MTRTLVLGGARSGKSTHAEALAVAAASVDYVATSRIDPGDAEWAARVAAHRARRPAHWHTLETADVAGVLAAPAEALVLVDCLGVWLARVLDDVGAWDGRDGWRAAADRRCDELATAVASTRRDVVLVSNEVGLGVVPEHLSGRLFRDLLGVLNMRVAAACDAVVLCVAGIPMPVKGTP